MRIPEWFVNLLFKWSSRRIWPFKGGYRYGDFALVMFTKYHSITIHMEREHEEP